MKPAYNEKSWGHYFTFKNIVFSTLIGLLVSLILWALSSLSPYLVEFLINISTSFSNWYYQELAKFNINDFQSISDLNILFVFFSVSLLLVLGFYNYTNDQIRHLKKQLSKIDKQKEKIFENDKEPVKSKLNLLENSSQQKRLISEINEKFNLIFNSIQNLTDSRNRKILILFFGFSCISLLLGSINILKNSFYTDQKLFKNRLVFLKPFITTYEFDMFQSNWVEMETKKDFDSIMKDIEKRYILFKK